MFLYSCWVWHNKLKSLCLKVALVTMVHQHPCSKSYKLIKNWEQLWPLLQNTCQLHHRGPLESTLHIHTPWHFQDHKVGEGKGSHSWNPSWGTRDSPTLPFARECQSCSYCYNWPGIIIWFWSLVAKVMGSSTLGSITLCWGWKKKRKCHTIYIYAFFPK